MVLSPAQIARFIDDGFVRLDDAFPRGRPRGSREPWLSLLAATSKAKLLLVSRLARSRRVPDERP